MTLSSVKSSVLNYGVMTRFLYYLKLINEYKELLTYSKSSIDPIFLLNFLFLSALVKI